MIFLDDSRHPGMKFCKTFLVENTPFIPQRTILSVSRNRDLSKALVAASPSVVQLLDAAMSLLQPIGKILSGLFSFPCILWLVTQGIAMQCRVISYHGNECSQISLDDLSGHWMIDFIFDEPHAFFSQFRILLKGPLRHIMWRKQQINLNIM